LQRKGLSFLETYAKKVDGTFGQNMGHHKDWEF
jgi:hypothetical protein